MNLCANRKRQKRIEFIRERRKHLRAKNSSMKEACDCMLAGLGRAQDYSEWRDTFERWISGYTFVPDWQHYFEKNYNAKVDLLFKEKLRDWGLAPVREIPWWECV